MGEQTLSLAEIEDLDDRLKELRGRRAVDQTMVERQA
jgi:hypothetical protein